MHSTNTYDNLPFDDLVRRDGKLYLVEVRAYLNGAVVGSPGGRLRRRARGPAGDDEPALLDGGPFAVFPGEQGVAFWRALWDAFKLEERLRAWTTATTTTCRPG